MINYNSICILLFRYDGIRDEINYRTNRSISILTSESYEQNVQTVTSSLGLGISEAWDQSFSRYCKSFYANMQKKKKQ